MKIKSLKWTIELEVSENWVADGFEMTDDTAERVREALLPYSYEHEVKVRIRKEPNLEAVAAIQGYEGFIPPGSVYPRFARQSSLASSDRGNEDANGKTLHHLL